MHISGMLIVMSTADVQTFDAIAPMAKRLREQLQRVIVGQDQTIDLLIAAVLCGGHTLLVGVPGLAKTLLVRSLSECLGWQFRRIQFTPDMMPADVVGTELIQQDANTGERTLRFVPGPIFANLVLADEINRTPPRTQAALLEAMAERQVTAAGHTHRLDAPFAVVATQNPIEQEGTYPLPEAQLDRFMFSLDMTYPNEQDEQRIVGERSPDDAMDITLDQICTPDDAADMARVIRLMPVSDHVRDYAVALARASRPDDAAAIDEAKQYLAWGAGPRAGQYLVLGAKALAAVAGEPAPRCEHIRSVAPAVLAHRIITNYAATGDGITTRKVVHALLQKVQEPGD